MLSIDAIRNSTVGATGTSSKKNSSYENIISQQQPKQAIRILNPSEAASMLYASGASGAARVTFSEQNTTPPSIYDFSKEELKIALDEIKTEGQGISYEGMSDAEIYNSVVKRYMDKFGTDLGVPSASRQWVNMNEMPNINTPHMAMMNEVYASISDGADIRQVRKEANGYSGMSDTAITAHVKDKYPEPSTLRDYMLMNRELVDMGIGRGTGIQHILLAQMSGGRWIQERTAEPANIGRNIWTALLDVPVDFSSIDNVMSNFEANGKRVMIADEINIGEILNSLGTSQLLSEDELAILKERFNSLLLTLSDPNGD